MSGNESWNSHPSSHWSQTQIFLAYTDKILSYGTVYVYDISDSAICYLSFNVYKDI